jgi:hypothetical protein
MPVKPLVVAFVAFMCSGSFAGANDACSGLVPEEMMVRLAGVDAAGDPVLTDGRSLRLLGLAPRQDAVEAARFAEAILDWRDNDLLLLVRAGADRWGRITARLFPADGQSDDGARDLASHLLRSGAATAMPEPGLTGCAGDGGMVAAQGQRPGRQAAVDGHDIAALKAQEGRLILLEGRIASVGERSQRTYINFSRRRGEAASIVLSQKLWRDLKDAGWTASGLSGKRLRAHGILSGRDGLLLDVTSRLALELVD